MTLISRKSVIKNMQLPRRRKTTAHTFIQAYCHWRQRFVLAIAWFSPHFPGFSLPGKDARSGRESCENL